MDKLLHLKEKVRAFADARDWDQFHSPKNLAMALIVEAAELVEHFQWLTEEQSAGLSAKTRQEVEAEMAWCVSPTSWTSTSIQRPYKNSNTMLKSIP